MSRHVILHPDDFARLGTGDTKHITTEDGTTIERDIFGVTKPGEGLKLTFPDQPLRLPIILPPGELPPIFQYRGFEFPRQKYSVVDECVTFRPRDYAKAMRRRSLKAKSRAQRRIDRTSRARARKRAAELRRRRGPSAPVLPPLRPQPLQAHADSLNTGNSDDATGALSDSCDVGGAGGGS